MSKKLNRVNVGQMKKLLACSLLGLPTLTYGPVLHAAQFPTDNWDISFDTTLTYGFGLRTEAPLDRFKSQYSNRAYDKWDFIQNNIQASHDLSISDKASRFGAFARGTYFYDFALADIDMNDAADNRAFNSGRVLDAYLYSRFGTSNQGMVKVGKQVINWGESTFIGSSLNDVNTVDLSKLRQPGLELKNALLPTPALDIMYQFPLGISVEAFALFEFDEVILDPSGSFFAGSDAALDGGGGIPAPDGGDTRFAGLTRGPSDKARNGGQWGIALRYFNQNIGPAGSDFALYYQNIHSHAPVFSTVAGSGTFFLDYPEDIRRYGASFNTLLGSVAVSGEYSYRPNDPIQGVDFYQVAFPTIVPPGGRLIPILPPNRIAASPGDVVPGYTRIKRHQAQITAQKNWIGAKYFLKADSVDTLGEVAVTYADRPDEGDFNMLNGVTKTAWGFVLNNSLTYNDLFSGVNVTPSVNLSWNVDGVSSDGLFVEGRKSVSWGTAFNWNIVWNASLSYTKIWGGEGERNVFGSRIVTNTDKDFMLASISYAF